MTLAMRAWLPEAGGEVRNEQMREQAEDVFLRAAGGDDFVGVQCYKTQRVGTAGILPPSAVAAAIRHARA